MTLIVSYMSNEEQLLVVDQRLTDACTEGPWVSRPRTHKTGLFCNPDQRYQFAFAYWGLAEIGRERTEDWLTRMLPQHMGPRVPLMQGARAFTDACTLAFKSVRFPAKQVGYVLQGRYTCSASQREEPFLFVISNCIARNGAQTFVLDDEFGCVSWNKRPHTEDDHVLRLYGNRREVKPHLPSWRRLRRLLRRPIASGAKLELVGRFVRRVGASADDKGTIGKDCFGTLMQQGQVASGVEWPEVKGRRESLPYVVFATGDAFTHASLPPSNAPQLPELDLPGPPPPPRS